MGCASSNPQDGEGEALGGAEEGKPIPTTKPQRRAYKSPIDDGVSESTEKSQASSSEHNPSGKLVFQMNGKTIDIVVGGEKFDLSQEPGYQPPPRLPSDMEEARVQALQDLGLDLHSREPSLDFITKLCGDLFPGCLAFLVFIDSEWTHIKSSWPPMSEKAPIDNRISCEAWMLLSLKPEMLIVEDLTKDRRFRKSPIVVDTPFFRSVAEVPLLSSGGHRIGAFGVLGFAPLKISGEMRQMLVNLASVAMKEVNLLSECHKRKQQGKLGLTQQPRQNSLPLTSYLNSSRDCICLLDMSQEGWKVLLSNQKWIHATGGAVDSEKFTTFWDSFQLAQPEGSGPAAGEAVHFAAAIQARSMFEATMMPRHGPSNQKFVIRFKPATSEQLDSSLTSVKIPAAGTGKTPGDRPYYFAILRSRATCQQKPSNAPRGGDLEGLKDSLADAREPPIPGVSLGPLLGRGSYGRVHLARWKGQKVAVKVIRMEMTKEESKAEDKQIEVIVGQKISHPNIVKALASGSIRIKNPILQSSHHHSAANGTVMENASEACMDSSARPNVSRDLTETWIILELCTEGSLQSAIDRAEFKTAKAGSWVPDDQKCIRTAAEIASAMAFLHKNSILHSDLSSSNVLLSKVEGQGGTRVVAKVSDFGLSREHPGQKTIATQTFGTVTHMPPELLMANRLNKAADVYAFGVLLWELYTGSRPWAGLKHAQIVAVKVKGLPKDQLQWPPGSNKTIKAIGQHCLQFDPHKRPTFDEVVERLEVLQPKELLQQKQRAL